MHLFFSFALNSRLSSRWGKTWLHIVFCAVASIYVISDQARPAEIDFQRDIRPILSDACFHCHGPDEQNRKSDLRLDTQAGMFADLRDGPTVVAGDPSSSQLYLRITHDAPGQRMPPTDAKRKLTDAEVVLIHQWIAAGAQWNELWSLVAPTRATHPTVSEPSWRSNPIDSFVMARLDKEHLRPSAKADRETLIRRATLDLTGLPPALDQVDAFLNDPSPVAFERAVDRLLASPRHGERMASEWLNAARYADTSGYQMDGPRQMWRWRDWIIDAFNSGMPYDQFTIEQCAGDLLPNPTLNQLIATAFHRNHRGNAEGGIIPEEYRVEYVVDRVETTSTVWLGLTVGCARCHDHKYDPITQREFYQIFAFFNNVPERGKARKWGNSVPHIKAPTPSESEALAATDRQIEHAEQFISDLDPELRAAQTEWERNSIHDDPRAKLYGEDKSLITPLLYVAMNDPLSVGGAIGPREINRGEGEPDLVSGRIGQAGQFDGRCYVELGDVAGFDYGDSFSISAWVYPQGESGGSIVSRMQSDTDECKGYSVELVDGHFHINLVHRWLDDCLRVRTIERFSAGQWYHVLATYDGAKVFGSARLYVDGKPRELEIIVDDLQQPFTTPDPFRIGSRGTHFRFHGLIDEVCAFDRDLSEEDARLLTTPDSIDRILRLPETERSNNQAFKLRRYFVMFHAPLQIRDAYNRLAQLQARREELLDGFSTVMVLQEMETPRDTFVLQRGRYDQTGEKVHMDVPACLPPFPENVKLNRLGLAQWLVDPGNPLTSRVAVNRTWQTIFGQGLVRTTEDFGSQGEKPSHPELLDWLAIEFQSTGWDLKRLLRTIITSATYRQSSRVTPEQLRADPENRLLTRGPRYRMSAEMIRDLALTTSGLLADRIGGPSVKPYQPAGLWVELTLEEARYVQDTGANLYRRSLYTYWKRTVAPPSMLVLDAPQRETCAVRISRTNTPLQALTLMNEVTYVEAARKLAERLLTNDRTDDRTRLEKAFRMVTSRRPAKEEIDVMVSALDFHRKRYRADLDAAQQLIGFGNSTPDASLEATELAAQTAVMNTLLNLDETITRE